MSLASVSKEENRAKGSMTIGDEIITDGRFFKKHESDPITGEEGYSYASTFYAEYRYTSNAKGRKFIDSVYIDSFWGSLHPEGKLKIWVKANKQTGFLINVHYEAAPNHNDDANDFVVRYIAPKFTDIIARNIKSALGNSALNIPVVLGEPR